MVENSIIKVTQNLKPNLSKNEMTKEISTTLKGLENIYSYIVYAKYKDNNVAEYIIQYNISENSTLNTLNNVDELTKSIIDIIVNSSNSNKKIIGYKQPPIDIMLKTYKPLIGKMAREQCDRWAGLEYEDAVSICQLTMIKLYEQGYYIHKGLLEKAYRNEILHYLRPERYRPECLSLDMIMHGDEHGNCLRLKDTIEDDNIKLNEQEQEYVDLISSVFSDVKIILVDMVGERGFEQLIRDYAHKHTSNWSRKKIQQIKLKFSSKGITWEKLIKNYI